MTQTLAVTEHITSLAQVESIFNLTEAVHPRFFTEWQAELPSLTGSEQARLDVIRQRYLYHRKHGFLAEGTVNYIVMSPLLELAGFYDPPFLLRSEVTVKIEVTDAAQVYRGRIDALVVQDQLWIVLIESKQTAFSLDVAIPQAIAYLMSHSAQQPLLACVSNGGYFMFIKVDRMTSQHALSSDFSLYRPRCNELCNVLQVLQRIKQTM